MNELNIHIRLKEARKFLKLNQLNIAKDLNIQQKTVSEIENGKLLNIPNKYIYYFFKKGISLNWIYDGSGAMMNNGKSASRTKENYENTVETLFDMLETRKESQKLGNIQKSRGEEEPKKQIDVDGTGILINSKDFNIKSLLSYVKSQENMIYFLQQIIKKEMNL